MKKLFLFLCLTAALLISGCSSIPDGPLPHAVNPQNEAQVYIMRSDEGVFWAVLPLNVNFDGSIIARLGTGEYVGFTVDYGFHDLGISDQTIRFPFERGRTYYFIIAPDDSAFGFGLSILGEEQGLRLLEQYDDINAEPVSIFN